MGNWNLTIVSSDIARLDLSGSGEVGIDTTDPEQIHQFGIRSSPLYSLSQPFAPDEGWEIWPNPKGEYFEANAESDPNLCSAMRQWWGGEVLPRGAGLLGELPAGRYYLARLGQQPV